LLKIDNAISYEEARPKNKSSVEMWHMIRNPDGHLLGGFLAKWKNEGPQSDVLVGEFKLEVGRHFDEIIRLEEEKNK